MKYTEVIYLDDIDDILGAVEKVIMDDKEVDEVLKIKIQQFVYEMEDYLKNKAEKCHIVDLRVLLEGDVFFPKR